MKLLFQKISLGVFIAIYISSLALSGVAHATQIPLAGTQQTSSTAEPLQRAYNPETGKLAFLGGGSPINVPGMNRMQAAPPQDNAMDFLSIYGSEFGLTDPSQELKLLTSQNDASGNNVVHYQQIHQGVPVFAGELIVNLNPDGELLSMSGEISSDLALDTNPTIEGQSAHATALNAAANWHGITLSELTATDPDLWIFDESLLTSSARPVELVWRMEVTPVDATLPIRELVLVNAQTGEISFHVNQVDTVEDHSTSGTAVDNGDLAPFAAASQIAYADLVVDESRGVLYGADKAGSKIDVINMADLSVASSYLLVNGALPTGIDLRPDGNELAVAQSGLSRVVFINLTDGTVTETPSALSGSSTKVSDVIYGRSGVLYAISSNGLHVIDTTIAPHAEDVTQFVTDGSSSYFEGYATLSADKNTLYYVTGTCCSGYNSLFRFDVSSALAKPVISNSTYIYGSGSRGNLRLSLIDENTIITTFGTIYDTSTLVPVARNGQVASPAIALPGRSFYVTSFDNTSGADLLYFLDKDSSHKLSSLTTSAIGTPGAMAVTSDGNNLFISSTGGMTKIDIGNNPPGMAIDAPASLHQYNDLVIDTSRNVLYGSDTSGRIDVIDMVTTDVIRSYLLPAGANPKGIDLSPDGTELAIALNGLEKILFIDPETGTKIAEVSPKLTKDIYYTNLPYDVIYGRTGRIYSDGNPSSGGIDYLHVIDTTTHSWIGKSISSLRTGAELAITSDKNYIYSNQTFSPNNIQVFDVTTDALPQVYTGPHGSVSANTFTIAPNGSKVFTSGGQVWDGTMQEQLGTLEGGSGKIVKYIPGLNIVALSANTTEGDVIRFLSPVNYRLLSTYGPIPNGTIREMESTPNGSKLFLNVNNAIQILDLDPSLPMTISLQSGAGQSVQVSTLFQDPLYVKVTNVLGNPISNKVVTFQGPSSGASVIFADTQNNVTSVTTDTNGIGKSPLFSANNVAGSYMVQAAVQNLNTSIGIQLKNLADVTCTISSGTNSPSLFLPYKQYRCGKTSYGVATGDFNTDGRRDIALSTNDSVLLIFLQDSNGNLSTQPRVYASSGSSVLAVGDLNHDGRDDIVVPNGTAISIFLQKADGTFPYPVIHPIGTSVGALAVGDVNNDNLPDIVVSYASNSIGVLTQNTNGTLNPIVPYPSLLSSEIAIGDVNGDGLNDVVSMTSQASNQLQVFLQNNNTLSPYFSIGLTNCSYSCSGGGIGIGDVTGDGRADIVMSYGGNRPNAYIAVFPQDANGNLMPATSYSSYDIPDPIEIADINADHLSDIITLHSGWSNAGVYSQLSNGTPGPETLYPIPYKSWYYPLDLKVGDVNSDGLPDLVIADITGLVVLYRNTTIPSTPTPIPTYTPSNTPGPTSTAGPGPTRTPGPTSTAGPSPTVVPPGSTGNRQTYTAGGGSSLPGTFLCDQTQASCTNGADPDADAAHQYAADTFVFYNTHHQRNSFDGQGGTIISTVNYGVGYQNAFWDGYQMVYGDNMAADDVVGHEITHGVTQYTSNLVYSYQSGAINESLSDIWGEFIDQTNGSGNDSPSVQWLMGEDTPLGAIRSMSYPTAYGDPDKMSSPYFYTGSGDNGGVHINSGVNNKAAYLMVQGGTFNGRTIIGIGMDKTAAVYYEAQTHLLTAGANYNDLYYALVQACHNLIGGADGITEFDCEQVRLAAEAVEMVTVPASTPTPSLVPTFIPTSSQPATVVPTNTPSPIPTNTFTSTPIPTLVISPTPISSGDTVRISVNSSGEQGLGYSFESSISADGRYIAFESHADNLVSGDTNNQDDIFLHDRLTGETTRVSVNSAGLQANNVSIYPSLSANGRYVAFSSAASNLVSDDSNTKSDIFVYDMQTRTTTRISVDSSGVQANGDSYSTSISADGRYIAFRSDATNLVSGDTNNRTDIFVHDRQTGVTSRVSVDSSGIQANSESYGQSISANGRYVSFESLATNLVTGDTNAKKDVFVYDRQTGITTRVSVDSSGIQGNNESYAPSISEDGRYVVFESGASNLVSGDTNATLDVFLHDRQTGVTTRVSLDTNGVQSNGYSGNSFITLNGNRVVFESNATNLVINDTNAASDIFVRDLQTGQTTRVSVASDGTQGNKSCTSFCYSFKLSASADGTYITFTSYSSNLVPNDTNASPDVFVHRMDIASLPTATATVAPSNTPITPTVTLTPSNTPITPSVTNTPVPPSLTPSHTPITPSVTLTPSHTPVTPSVTLTPSNTPITPSVTNTPVPPSLTPSNTPVTPTVSLTPSNTPVTPTVTFTSVWTPTLVTTATKSSTPLPTFTPSRPYLKSEIVAPASILSLSGTTSGSPSSLSLFDQTGIADDPAAYVTFQTPNGAYTGYQTFTLPDGAQPNLVSTMLLQVNFKAPATSQIWTWSVYDWDAGMWIKIGDSIGAKPNEWQTLKFRIRQPRRSVSSTGEIRIQLRSNNSNGDAKIDYEGLHITYLSVPAANTPMAPVHGSGRPGTASVHNTQRP